MKSYTVDQLRELFPDCPLNVIVHFDTDPVFDEEGCHAGKDGDCIWPECPQLKDGEPAASGRTCPLWKEQTDD